MSNALRDRSRTAVAARLDVVVEVADQLVEAVGAADVDLDEQAGHRRVVHAERQHAAAGDDLDRLVAARQTAAVPVALLRIRAGRRGALQLLDHGVHVLLRGVDTGLPAAVRLVAAAEVHVHHGVRLVDSARGGRGARGVDRLAARGGPRLAVVVVRDLAGDLAHALAHAMAVGGAVRAVGPGHGALAAGAGVA